MSRTQTVVLDGESWESLGPLLFSLHINELPEDIQAQVGLFAEDTAGYLAVRNNSDIAIIQADQEWLETWERA